MKVMIRVLNTKLEDVEAGQLIWDGQRLSITVSDENERPTMEALLTLPVTLRPEREKLSPSTDPERYFNNLWRIYKWTAIRASKPMP